jgi:broad specificity phosphatase PhoE
MVATELWLVRHGESTANVAAADAEARGQEMIEVDHRDADVPLSDLGRQQARRLGDELVDRGIDDVPTTVWTSPYRRARETFEVAASQAGFEASHTTVDERLRDRELGILDRLTRRGVNARFPDEAARRQWLGKFYHRPPGGESWADVMLRLRSVIPEATSTRSGRETTDDADGRDHRVLLVTHDVIVTLTVAICLGWDEEQLLAFTKDNVVQNASLTRLSRRGADHPWQLDEFSAVEHLADDEVTSHPGSREALRP